MHGEHEPLRATKVSARVLTVLASVVLVWAMLAAGATGVAGSDARSRGTAPPAVAAQAFSLGRTTPIATLMSSDPTSNEAFGFSAAMSGDTALVGAYGTKSGAGAAYVFTRSGNSWSGATTLPSVVTTPNSWFGYAAALDGDTALVGAPRAFNHAGAAYVFTRSGGAWSAPATLTASSPTPFVDFGLSVALSGDSALVGAPNENAGAGAVYIFNRTGSAWGPPMRLAPPVAPQWLQFGYAVALSHDVAVVGAKEASETLPGAAFVYTLFPGGWSGPTTLSAPVPTGGDHFGRWVAVDGGTILVGAYGTDTDRGAAYVFTRSGGAWAMQSALATPPLTGGGVATGAGFGRSAAVVGDIALVGAPYDATSTGGAFVYSRSGTSWNGPVRLTSSAPTTRTSFGRCIAFDGDTALVGAPETGNYTGAVYIFDVAPPVTTLHVSPAVPNGPSGWYRTRPAVSFTTNEAATTYFAWDSTATSSTYSATLTVPLGTHTLNYFSVDAAADNTEAVHSQTFKVLRPVALTRPSTPAAVTHGRTFTVFGYLRPKVGGKTRVAFYRKVGHSYRKFTTVVVSNKRVGSSRSKYSLRIRLTKRGKWYVQSSFPGTTGFAPATSPRRFFRVT